MAVIAIQANGSLGAATDTKKDEGPLGPPNAASAPPGSFAISGHDHPHAHMIEADPSGRFVMAADLGMDQILVWKFDVEKGTLTPADPPSAPAVVTWPPVRYRGSSWAPGGGHAAASCQFSWPSRHRTRANPTRSPRR